jgi:hypothetical protein
MPSPLLRWLRRGYPYGFHAYVPRVAGSRAPSIGKRENGGGSPLEQSSRVHAAILRRARMK